MTGKAENPAVSVIIPNYNHARFLRRRIESVLAQTYENFEVIVMDDCSTDQSRAVIGEYAKDPRVRVVFNETNSGSTFKQWNRGVRLARGKYVWIAESDDYADERLLKSLVAMLDKDQTVMFANCRSHRVTAEDRPDGLADSYLDGLHADRWQGDFCVDGREECRNYFVLTNPVPNASAVVFRKDAYEKVGGADENMRTCGDWKLWAALAMAGKVGHVGEPLNYFRFHDKSVRRQCEQVGVDTAENLRVVRWILERVKPTESVLKRARLQAAHYWIPAVFGGRVPLGRRLEILRNAMAIDPYAPWKPARIAISALRQKFLRYWREARSAKAL
jgi:hypothetical protein